MRNGRRAKRIRTTSLMVGETNLNCLIRNSSTSLETSQNHQFPENGCYGHLSARTTSSQNQNYKNDDLAQQPEMKAMRILENSTSQQNALSKNHLVVQQNDQYVDESSRSKQQSSAEQSEEDEVSGKCDRNKWSGGWLQNLAHRVLVALVVKFSFILEEILKNCYFLQALH